MITDQVFINAWKDTEPFPWNTPFSQFVDNSSINRMFMTSDLAKSALTQLHMNTEAPRILSNTNRVAEAGYFIGYLGLDGQPIKARDGSQAMYRIRFKLPEFSKEARYTQPSSEQLAKEGLPGSIPYFHPLTFRLPGEVMICAEGEKKTAAAIRHLGLPAFGIGGCHNWRDPNRSDGIHPWILELLKRRGTKKVLIVPDGDFYRYDICNAYGTFAYVLRELGFEVEIVALPGKIDDLIVGWGDSAESAFAAVERVNPESLVQSPAMLAKRYNLAYKQTDKGVVVHQNSSNVTILLEKHRAFKQIWRNTDDNRVYIGEDMAVPDMTEMQIANYFQHNLGFEKVNSKLVYACVQALAKKNQKSPMLEWVKGLQWDGTPRLATWLQRIWGVEDSEFVREVGVKWLTSACARMDKPGTKVDWMMIVVGPQGVGKTSMPSVVFKGNSLTLYGESNDKDLHMKIHSALVIGFDELDSFGKKESSFLKAMITTSQDHFRPPYGSSVEVFDRRCTLYGCGNRYEFLQQDQSGYRRYAIVEVTRKLDFAALQAELDQLWAEAWTLYTSGNQFWEVERASENASNYVIPSPLQERIQDVLSRQFTMKTTDKYKNGELLFTLSDLYMWMNEGNVNNPNYNREVAAILKNLGATQKSVRVNGTPRRVYSYKQGADD